MPLGKWAVGSAMAKGLKRFAAKARGRPWPDFGAAAGRPRVAPCTGIRRCRGCSSSVPPSRVPPIIHDADKAAIARQLPGTPGLTHSPCCSLPLSALASQIPVCGWAYVKACNREDRVAGEGRRS